MRLARDLQVLRSKTKIKKQKHIGKILAICDKGQSPYYKKSSWKSIKDEYYNRNSTTKPNRPNEKMKRTFIMEKIQHDRKTKKTHLQTDNGTQNKAMR